MDAHDTLLHRPEGLASRLRYDRSAFGDAVYGITDIFIVTFGLAFVLALFATGLILAVTVVGLVFLGLALAGARRLANWEGARTRALLRRPAGVLEGPERRPGLMGSIRSEIGHRSGWRAFGWLLVKLPMAMLTSAVTLLFWGGGVAELTYPLWFPLTGSVVGADGEARPGGQVWGGLALDSWPSAFAAALVGVLLLLAAPRATRAVVALNARLTGALLGHPPAER
ncbi:sensor domain-containing protein [Micromonospora siamensis]|uniref:Putative sensor n=1 Tax=Micromonospora siamensis TaxID=299152 RepID=A0A1C5HEY1_9ACTN|nr:sensor domain-containing protein [Micromonospora siamensis]SCG44417.1 Putative sensor [Micromonospora siamensis]